MTTEIPRFDPIDKERLAVLAGTRGPRENHAVRFKDADKFFADFSKVAGDLPRSIYNSKLALVASMRCTYGGTSNAITLTTGVGLKSIPTGFKVRFRSALNNTGPTTINIDGLGPVVCQTVNFSALPNVYILTGADTEAIYNGTVWVVDREDVQGNNANGRFRTYANGMVEAFHSVTAGAVAITTAVGGLHRSAEQIYPLPITFATITGGYAIQASGEPDGVWTISGPNSVSDWAFRALRVTSSGSVNVGSVFLYSFGTWY